MKALVLIDCQNGFIDGNLGIGYDKFASAWTAIEEELKKDYDLFIFTKDWHPANHCSFKEFGGIWPAHCVRNTADAELYWKIKEFYENLPAEKKRLINKGQEPSREEYGADVLADGTDVQELVFCGLCIDYCVSESAILTLQNHPQTMVRVRLDACGAIAPETAQAAIARLKDAGVEII